MKFSEFSHIVSQILDADLPKAASILKECRSVADSINIGRTAFMAEMGVGSELEYKRQCIKDRKIMFHAHIGLNSWQATADALACLNSAVRESGHIVDRAGICLDRRMGLPKEYRQNIPPETGPMLESDQDWRHIGQAAPIQPHMGDFMIGFPAAVENTIHALKAGVTTIGNLSQFFAHEVPMWQDTIATTVATVKAIAIMGALRDKGTLVHSYLEDGFGALFCDCATAAGWACLEKYIVEDLLGARLAHCIGGLTIDPVKRAGWVFALNEIHANDCIGSMIYGDTLSFGPDFSENRGLVAEYMMWDIMAQLQCPTGHAVLPLPVTEALRIPSAAEIAEAQILGRRIEQTARRLLPYMDFGAAEAFSKTILQAGKSAFENSLAGLNEAGVDLRDPIQLLYVLKKLGPAVFEEMFGAGESNLNYARGRRPVIATDVFELSNRHVDRHRHIFTSAESKRLLKDRRILIASTDVHEHAVMIIHMLLAEAGAKPIYLGAEANPEKVASAACVNKAEAILISTHNGMALEYARCLKDELDQHRAKIPVVMGGILNQKVADRPLPIDVSADLKKLDFYLCSRLEGRFRKLLESGIFSQGFNR
jgi:methylmalonyl-CoA mutase cobalamin-binding subunit